jgi:hypothetical protein
MLYVFTLFTLTYQEIVKKTIGFYATDIITLLTGQISPSYRVDWLETWHRLDWERIFILGEILLENTVITDFICPSVNRDRFFSYYCLQEKKIVHTHTCCRTLQSFLTQKNRVEEIFLLTRIKILQFCFRKLLVQVSITIQID